MRTFATCAILLGLACSVPAQQTSTGGGSAPTAQTQSGSDTAARVGNRTITVGELDERWRRDDAAQQAQAFQQLYEGRKTRWTRSLPRC